VDRPTAVSRYLNIRQPEQDFEARNSNVMATLPSLVTLIDEASELSEQR